MMTAFIVYWIVVTIVLIAGSRYLARAIDRAFEPIRRDLDALQARVDEAEAQVLRDQIRLLRDIEALDAKVEAIRQHPYPEGGR